MIAGKLAGENIKSRNSMLLTEQLVWSSPAAQQAQVAAGLRLGEKGTHSSRTMMLSELTELLATVPKGGARKDYTDAIVRENALGKQTASNRRLTNQRLGELYGLDPSLPIFRVLRRLWDADESGRPLLALLCALARDPMLRATAPSVIALRPGEELSRSAIPDAISEATEGRMNPSITDKVARNARSSWTQSNHLEGRVRKIRRSVGPSAGAAAFALWLGSVQGLTGEDLLISAWAKVLDAGPSQMLDLTLRAKQLGLVEARVGGGVVEIEARTLDPAERRR